MTAGPKPPLLGLNLYFGSVPEKLAFRDVVYALLRLGAGLAGEGRVHLGPNFERRPFASIADDIQRGVAIQGVSDLEHWLNAPNTRLVRVNLKDAVGAWSGATDIVTYLGVSREAAQVDRHPLCVWTDGWIFTGDFREMYPEEMCRIGRRVYGRFCRLVQELRPAYGAITIEYPLECLADLRLDPRSLAFRDFYVSRAFVGEHGFGEILRLSKQGYVELLSEGAYISYSREYNPVGLTSEAGSSLSGDIARIVARAGGVGA